MSFYSRYFLPHKHNWLSGRCKGLKTVAERPRRSKSVIKLEPAKRNVFRKQCSNATIPYKKASSPQLPRSLHAVIGWICDLPRLQSSRFDQAVTLGTAQDRPDSSQTSLASPSPSISLTRVALEGSSNGGMNLFRSILIERSLLPARGRIGCCWHSCLRACYSKSTRFQLLFFFSKLEKSIFTKWFLNWMLEILCMGVDLPLSHWNQFFLGRLSFS